MRDDRLACGYVHLTVLVPHSHGALEHQGELIEFGSLSGFFPALRAAHVGDAYAGRLGVDASNVFIDELGLGSHGGNASGLRYQGGHECSFKKDYCSKTRHNFGSQRRLTTKDIKVHKGKLKSREQFDV